MEVLSNKEIYVLLKILNDKKVKEGSSSTIEVDKNFSLKELEHLQQEISLTEGKAPEEVFTIENAYINMLGQSILAGYKLNIENTLSFKNYAQKYIEALIQEDLTGDTPIDSLSVLMNDFYSATNGSPDLDYLTINDIKYMPVVLFAYVNNLVELKSLSVRKYDLRGDLNKDILRDDVFNQTMDDTLGLMMRMNACELFQNFDEYINTCDSDKKKFLESIQGFVNTFSKKKANAEKPKKTADVIKSRNHMKPQQWKIFISLKKEIDKRQISNGTIDIPKDMFIMLGIFGKESGQQDTAISRFNSDYNKIMKIPKKEAEKVIWTKVSDTNWYQFSASKITSLYNRITEPKRDDDNNTLFEEFQKYKHFLNLSK